MHHPKPFVKWVPNALTLLRLLLCPFVVYLFLERRFLISLSLFVLAAISDLIDAYLARRLSAVSAFGGILDPVCDKLYCGALFALLMAEGVCPAWFLAFMIATSLLLCSGFLILRLPRRLNLFSFSPTHLARWNAGLQVAWIGILLVELAIRGGQGTASSLDSTVQLFGFLALALLQTLVFFRYFLRFRRYFIPEPRSFLAVNR